MNDKKKFLFDLNYFDEDTVLHQKEDPNTPPPPPTFTEEELEAAKKEAFAAGKQEGIAQAKEDIEQKTLHVLQSIAQELSGLFSCEQDRNALFAETCAALCYQALRKAFPVVYRHIGPYQLEQLLIEHLSTMKKEPLLDINLHPDLADKAEKRINELKTRIGAQGEWTILEDEKLDLAGCQILWNHGGLDFHPEQIMDAVLKTFEPHLKTLSSELDEQEKTLHNEGSEDNNDQPPISEDTDDIQIADIAPDQESEEPEHG